MVDVCENSVFRDDVIDLSQFDDVRLLQALHGIELSSSFIFRKHHSAEGT